MSGKIWRFRNLWTLPVLCLLGGAASAAIPVGSVVMYSDGRVEKLLSHKDGELLWEDDRKRRYLRSENPVMPVLGRKDFLSGKSYSQAVNDGNPDEIHARPSGTRLSFSIVRTGAKGERTIRHWDCRYLGSREDTVLGVMRKLDAYDCERFVVQRKTWQRQFRESRRFSYSRDLGLVVDMQRKTRTKSRQWKLVSIVSPDKADYASLSKQVRSLRAAK